MIQNRTSPTAPQSTQQMGTHGAVLNTIDLSELAKQYLTPGALSDVYNTLGKKVPLKENQLFSTIGLGVQVKTEELSLGVQTIAQALNELSHGQLIHNTLAPISSTKMDQYVFEHESFLVYCFIEVPADVVSEIKHKYKDVIYKEGYLPTKIGNIYTKLEPGFILCETVIHYSHNMGLTKSDELLEQQIHKVLCHLPTNTSFIKHKRIPSHFIPSAVYEVLFYNPEFAASNSPFKDVKFIKCNEQLHFLKSRFNSKSRSSIIVKYIENLLYFDSHMNEIPVL